MPSVTDPARDLAEVCDRLSGSVHQTGDAYLAKHFAVQPWSREFFKIISSIIDQIELVRVLISQLDLDNDIMLDAIQHVDKIRLAFARDSLFNTWNNHNSGAFCLARENVQPIKMLSSQIRKKISYPKLSDDEVAKVLNDLSELKSWLKSHELEEKDFIREAILHGIEEFEFRLLHLGWVGWGYALESLKEVIGAYLALERGFEAPDAYPQSVTAHPALGGARSWGWELWLTAGLDGTL